MTSWRARLGGRRLDLGQRVILAAVLLGGTTGLTVALIERAIATGFIEPLLEAPLGVQLAAPTAALLVTALVMVHLASGATRSLSDEYLHAFHERDRRLYLRELPARLLAGAATLAGGCAMGFEAISLHTGATFGSALQHRLRRWFTRDEAKVLMVAGAAAGALSRDRIRGADASKPGRKAAAARSPQRSS